MSDRSREWAKRVLSVFLSLAMVWSSVPTQALAEAVDEAASQDGIELIEENELTEKLAPEEQSAEEVEAATDDDATTEETTADEANAPPAEDAEPGEEPAMPAFTDEVAVEGADIIVRVEAEEGAFPEDVHLEATMVKDEAELAAIDRAVEREREEDASVAVSANLDIRVVDASGNEVEPAGGEKVNVSFASKLVADANLQTAVYHVTEKAEDEAVAVADERTQFEAASLEVKADEADDEVALVETDGFSYYTVEFTYGAKQYVLEGDSKVALQEIVDYVGLEGEATAATTSNPALFSVEDEEGTLMVVANQAFSTTEWMKVTVNGVEYEVVVTDAVPIVEVTNKTFNSTVEFTGNTRTMAGYKMVQLAEDVSDGVIGTLLCQNYQRLRIYLNNHTLDLKSVGDIGNNLNSIVGDYGSNEAKLEIMGPGKLIIPKLGTSNSSGLTGTYSKIYGAIALRKGVMQIDGAVEVSLEKNSPTTKVGNEYFTSFTYIMTNAGGGQCILGDRVTATWPGFENVKIALNDSGSFRVSANIITYTINCDVNGGTLASSNPTTYNVMTDTFTLNNPEPPSSNMEFVGWDDLTTEAEERINPVTIEKGSTGNRSYKAVYERLGYTISYDLRDNNANNADNLTFYEEQHSAITLKYPTRTGFEFVGWSGTDINGIQKDVTIPAEAQGNRSYRAWWKTDGVQITTWAQLQQELDSCTEVTLTQSLTAPAGASALTVSSGDPSHSLTLNLAGYTLDRGLEKGSAVDGGQVLSVGSGADLTITGSGTLTGGNNSDNGGGIVVDGANLTLEGVTVSGNKSTANGGGIWSENGSTISLRGSTNITGNSASTGAGGIGFSENGASNNVRVSGKVKVKENTANGVTNNMQVSDGLTYVDFDEFDSTTRNYCKIGISLADPRLQDLSAGYSANVSAVSLPSSVFVADDPDSLCISFNADRTEAYAYYLPVVTINTNGGTWQDGYGVSSVRATCDAATVPETGLLEAQLPLVTDGDDYVLMREGYTFKVWSSDAADDTSHPIASGGKVQFDARNEGAMDALGNQLLPAEDITYYAHWNIIEYNITYKDGFGNTLTNTQNPATYTYEESQSISKSITKDGYTFKGWWRSDNVDMANEQAVFTAKASATISVSIPQHTTGDREYTAAWEADSNAITYLDSDLDTSHPLTGTGNPQSYKTGEGAEFDGKPSKLGYTFVGWWLYTEGMSTSEQEAARAVADPKVTIGLDEFGPRTYVAEWTKDKYDITYLDYDGSKLSGTGNDASYYVDSTVSIAKGPGVTRPGYDFAGWWRSDDVDMDDDAAVAEAKKTAKLPVDAFGPNVTGDRTYTAAWIPSSLSITYADLGEDGQLTPIEGTGNPPTYSVEEDVSFKGEPAKRAGYTFVGWWLYTGTGMAQKDKEDAIVGATKEIEFEAGTYTTSLTYVAKWQPIEYDITYLDVDGNALPDIEGNPKKYTTDKGAKIKKAATKDGYTFEGWVLGDEDPQTTVEIKAGETGDVTLYAAWTAEQYTARCLFPNATMDIKDSKGNVLITKKDEHSYGFDVERRVVLDEPYLKHYDFQGWKRTDSNASAEEKTKPEKNVILQGVTGNREYTADFTLHEYQIQYELNDTGDEVTESNGTTPDQRVNNKDNLTTSYTYETDTFSLVKPTRYGHDFIGWTWEGQEEPVLEVSIGKHSENDRTYTANWTTASYTLDAYTTSNSASKQVPATYTVAVTPTQEKYTHDSEVILTADDKRTEGWDFVGFRDVTDADGVIAINEASSNTYEHSYNEATGTYSASLRIHGNSKIAAVYSPIDECVVTYHPNNYTGDIEVSNPGAMEPQTLFYQIPAHIESNAYSRRGYEFLGWNESPEPKADGSVDFQDGAAIDNPERSMDLYAQWKLVTYDIAYKNCVKNSEGAYIENSNLQVNFKNTSYTTESPSVTLENPKLEGYEFDGWTYEGQQTPGAAPTITTHTTIGAKEFTANWTPIVYTIRLNAGSGTFPGSLTPGNRIKTYTYTIESNPTLDLPDRSGYEFDGWEGDYAYVHSERVDANTKNISVPVGTTGDIRLTATWKAKSNKYYLFRQLYVGDTAGAVTAMGPAAEGAELKNYALPNEADHGSRVSIAAEPIDGYQFFGWFEAKVPTDADGNVVVDSDDRVTATGYDQTKFFWPLAARDFDITRDMYLVGVYKNVNTYNITFYGNAEEFDDTTQYHVQENVYEGVETELDALDTNLFAREGFDFDGWTADAKGEGQRYADKAKIQIWDDQTLYAQWTPRRYYITYLYDQGVAPETPNPAYYTSENTTSIENAPTKRGYDFKGWLLTKLDNQAVEGEAAQLTVTIPVGQSGDREYKAQWLLHDYTISCDEYGGKYVLDGQEVDDPNDRTFTIESGEYTLVNPTKDGYTFAGWLITDKDGNNIGGAAKSTVTIGENSIDNRYYKATWTENPYAITYVGADGSDVITTNETSYSVEDLPITLSDPTRDGYEFIGWTGKGAPEPTKGLQVPAGTAENLTYTAHWKYTMATYSLTSDNTSSVADITLEPQKSSYSYDEEVEVTAKPSNIKWSFLGWYKVKSTRNGVVTNYDSKRVSSDLSYTFNVKDNTSLVAVFDTNTTGHLSVDGRNGGRYTMVVTDSQGKAKYSFAAASGTDIDLEIGDKVALTAVDDKVDHWENGKSKVLGRGRTYTFTMTGDVSVKLIYRSSDSSANSFVQFLTPTDQVLSCMQYTTADKSIVFPVAPGSVGEHWVEWRLDGTETEVEEEDILGLIGTQDFITVRAYYESDKVEGSVSVHYVCEEKNGETTEVKDIKEADTFKPYVGTQYIASTDETIEGTLGENPFEFICWKDADGTVLGYKTSYPIMVSGNHDVYAWYSREPVVVKQEPTLSISKMDAFTTSNSNGATVLAVKATITWTTTDDYTVKEVGCLRATNPSEEMQPSWFVRTYANRSNTGFPTFEAKQSKLYKNGNYTQNTAVKLTDEVWLRGYLVVEDAKGTTLTYYTSIVHGTYADLASD